MQQQQLSHFFLPEDLIAFSNSNVTCHHVTHGMHSCIYMQVPGRKEKDFQLVATTSLLSLHTTN